ncbi:NUDIX hydrolase [Sansalvadorimonas sp. 2012CJ34-2]|uniref:NUDIX hydrolase n=1 Tax=Parendozoicomonas callyspongiae TaxID=2942213 RepID=A0ABT0PD45_9GAMM|nr:NUDIX hydrolase [Sansalvadorimonas sp. 2012CJ34-2]MCL6269181.1 NUDIX hydrolase [Sansalvadorimonas sp. 2012CJ34-2]
MVTETVRPAIGVGAIILRGNKVLLGLRKGKHGDGCWQFPGGHLEYGEAIEECARREVLEETGLNLENILIGPYTNDVFAKDKKHYVTLFTVAESHEGEATVMEPDKCSEWGWFEWDKMPKPLFLPIRHLLEKGYSPFLKS